MCLTAHRTAPPWICRARKIDQAPHTQECPPEHGLGQGTPKPPLSRPPSLCIRCPHTSHADLPRPKGTGALVPLLHQCMPAAASANGDDFIPNPIGGDSNLTILEWAATSSLETGTNMCPMHLRCSFGRNIKELAMKAWRHSITDEYQRPTTMRK